MTNYRVIKLTTLRRDRRSKLIEKRTQLDKNNFQYGVRSTLCLFAQGRREFCKAQEASKRGEKIFSTFAVGAIMGGLVAIEPLLEALAVGIGGIFRSSHPNSQNQL
jgi:chemotaxis response regulator CheB